MTVVSPIMVQVGTIHAVGFNRGRRGAERAICEAAGRVGGKERESCRARSVGSRADGAGCARAREGAGAPPLLSCVSFPSDA